MNIRSFHTILVVIIAALTGYYVGVNKVTFDWKNYRPDITVESKEPPSTRSNVDFSLFWNVWDRLEATYYDKKAIDPQKMLHGAISGMIQSLGDPYTVYLPPVQNTDFKQGMAGQFEGIGAELGIEGKQIIVVAPLDGMPAQKAGVKAGDAILRVNDQSTLGWTLSQAVEKIRGPRGTEVSLAITRKDEQKSIDIKIIRQTITVKSITSWVKKVKDIDSLKLDKKYAQEEIAYIRLSQFGDNTNQEWVPEINKIVARLNQNRNVKGVILDLRNNPGGYLTDATFIASEFIKNGVVVIQEKENGNRSEFSVNRNGLLTEVPMVVLINKGSASASEIVAGALRDHNRATLVGETSFGKGTIQQAEDLGNGAGLHVTIAKWLTPNGTWIHEKGLKPDIEVALDEKNPKRDLQLEKAVEELVQ